MSATISLNVNESISVTTIINDAYGAATSAKNVNYVSSDPTIAILANSGTFVAGSNPQNSVSTNVITGIKNGSAVVTVTIDGSVVVDTISVTVHTNPPAELTFVFGTPIQT